MRLELTGRHITITPDLRALVNERLAKLDRLLHDSALSLQAILSVERGRHCVELTLHARGDHFLHGEGTGRDWSSALTLALSRMNQQARKLKGKWTGRKRQAPPAAAPAALQPARPRRPERRAAAAGARDTEVRIIRARRYEVKPMSVDDAAIELGSTDAFIVFRDEATDAVAVLFRRPDGHLGLIEPEI